ncbi:uncharacterized protein LOC125740436 isoform X3 [Brienomyrus brachyistius]|uniref:uncharacterized protein LOC125740436 isoform X3 n=1 Tax=Brienomyrus brachyistius TaxID=42636 RepID=UPI0020B3904E|nr:uncharacterized protein LOC125740436 isoform X3 [Brienomyrus brachyistius]
MEGVQESPETTETMEGKTQGTQESPETTETMEGKTQGTQENPETMLQFLSSADNDFQMTSERRKASDLWSNEEMDQCGEGVEQHGGEASHLCGGEGVDQHGGEGVDQRGGEGVDQRGGEASHLYGVEDSWFCVGDLRDETRLPGNTGNANTPINNLWSITGHLSEPWSLWGQDTVQLQPLSEQVWNQPWRSYKPMKAHLSNRGQLDFGGETRVLNRGQGVDQHRRRASRPSGEAPDLCGDEELGLRGDEVSDLRVVTHQNCMGHVSKPWSLWGQDTMTFHLLPEQSDLDGEAWDLSRGQGVHQHGRRASHLSGEASDLQGGEASDLHGGEASDLHGGEASDLHGGEASDLHGGEELGLRGDEVSDLRSSEASDLSVGHLGKPWSLWGQDTMTFHLLPEQLYLGGEAWDLNRGQGVHQHGRRASHLSGEASDLHGGEASDLHGGEASDLHGGEELGLRGDEVSDLRGGEELGLRVVTHQNCMISFHELSDEKTLFGSLPLREFSCVKDPTEFMEREDKLGNSLQEPSSPQHHRASTSATIDMDWILELVLNERLFTPDVEETCNVKVYRFLASHAGRFFCCVTGLGFEVESGGEVTYSFCSWEKAPQTSSSWSPAGPIFDIECPQGTLKELHLPHCEMMFADENLAVAHVSNDNMEILHPLEVTDTHVVISITHLSGFGVIKRKESSKVRGQVLLLLRPKPQILNVFLLPLNVPPDQVHQQMQHRHNIFIPTSSMCTLIHKRRYRMSCNPKAIRRIQLKNEKFEYSFDQTIHPTFEVFLKRDVVEVDLSVLQDRSGKVVWRRFIDLTDAVLPSSITEEEDQSTGVAFVDQHREAIVQRVSLIEPLLDELHKHISEEKFRCDACWS